MPKRVLDPRWGWGSTQARAAPNYRSFIATGTMHTMWGSDKVYTDTSGGVPLVDRVTAMIDGTSAWTNV